MAIATTTATDINTYSN